MKAEATQGRVGRHPHAPRGCAEEESVSAGGLSLPWEGTVGAWRPHRARHRERPIATTGHWQMVPRCVQLCVSPSPGRGSTPPPWKVAGFYLTDRDSPGGCGQVNTHKVTSSSHNHQGSLPPGRYEPERAAPGPGEAPEISLTQGETRQHSLLPVCPKARLSPHTQQCRRSLAYHVDTHGLGPHIVTIPKGPNSFYVHKRPYNAAQ